MALATTFETTDAVILQSTPATNRNSDFTSLLSSVAMTTEANKGESWNAIMSQIILLKKFFLWETRMEAWESLEVE